MVAQLKRMNPVVRLARRSLRAVGVGKPIARWKLNRALKKREKLLKMVDAEDKEYGRRLTEQHAKSRKSQLKMSELDRERFEHLTRLVQENENLDRDLYHRMSTEQLNLELAFLSHKIADLKNRRKQLPTIGVRVKLAGPFVKKRLKRANGKVLLGGKSGE